MSKTIFNDTFSENGEFYVQRIIIVNTFMYLTNGKLLKRLNLSTNIIETYATISTIDIQNCRQICSDNTYIYIPITILLDDGIDNYSYSKIIRVDTRNGDVLDWKTFSHPDYPYNFVINGTSIIDNFMYISVSNDIWKINLTTSETSNVVTTSESTSVQVTNAGSLTTDGTYLYCIYKDETIFNPYFRSIARIDVRINNILLYWAELTLYMNEICELINFGNVIYVAYDMNATIIQINKKSRVVNDTYLTFYDENFSPKSIATDGIDGYVLNTDGNVLYKITLDQGVSTDISNSIELSTVFTVQESVQRIIIVNEFMYLTNGKLLKRLNLSTNIVETYTTISENDNFGCAQMCSDGTYIYIPIYYQTDYGDYYSRIISVDTRNGDVLDWTPVSFLNNISIINGSCILDNFMYISNDINSTIGTISKIYKINLTTSESTSIQFTVSGGSGSLTTDGKYLYCIYANPTFTTVSPNRRSIARIDLRINLLLLYWAEPDFNMDQACELINFGNFIYIVYNISNTIIQINKKTRFINYTYLNSFDRDGPIPGNGLKSIATDGIHGYILNIDGTLLYKITLEKGFLPYFINSTELSSFFTLAESVPNTIYTPTGYTQLYNNEVFDLGQIYINFSTIPSFDTRTITTNYKATVDGVSYDIGKILSNSYLDFTFFGSSSQNGTNGTVYAIAVDIFDQVYIGGNFTEVYSSNITTKVNNIALWVGNSQWDRLGSNAAGSELQNGINGPVYTMKIDNAGDYMYIGGNFTSVYSSQGTMTANNIVIWDTNNDSWIPLGSTSQNGTNNKVLSIAIDNNIGYATRGRVYVGGEFTTVNNSGQTINVNSVAYWNNSWFTLGSSTQNGLKDSLRSNVPLGDSTLGSVRSIKIDINSNVYVCGKFDQVSSSTQSNMIANNIAMWSPSANTSPTNIADSWSPLGSMTNGTNNAVFAITQDNSGNIYIGGSFASINIYGNKTLPAKSIAMWNGNYWSPLGDSNQNGTNGTVYAIEVDSDNNVYVGGAFTTVSSNSQNGLNANNIAIWNGTQWSACGILGTLNSNGVRVDTGNVRVNSILIDSINNVYIGGLFRRVYSSTQQLNNFVNNIAIWNNSSKVWSALGTLNTASSSTSSNGVGGGTDPVKTIQKDQSTGYIYVGGTFTSVASSSQSVYLVKSIAYWYNSQWFGLGSTITTTATQNGVYGSVNSIKIQSSSIIYVGGSFTRVYTTNTDYFANNIVIWNGTNWEGLGATIGTTSTSNGTQNIVYSMELDNNTNTLYIGTQKVNFGGLVYNANYIVSWNNSQWFGLGGQLYTSTAGVNGTNGIVRQIKLIDSKIYLGGDFTLVNNDTGTTYPANRIVIYYNSNWFPFAGAFNTYTSVLTTLNEENGTDDRVFDIEITDNYIYVGGKFTIVKDGIQRLSSSYITRFNKNTFAWENFVTITIGNGIYPVKVLKKDNSNNLYVGGDFITADDINVNGIFLWNGSVNRIGGITDDMTIYDHGTAIHTISTTSANVYIGGCFTMFQSSNANNIIQMASY